MFEKHMISPVAEYVHENHIALSDHDAVESALLRIVPEAYDMPDEARRELVAAIVVACQSKRPASN